MKLSVVIPTHKNIYLREVLESLTNNYGYDPTITEIIIVENPEITLKTLNLAAEFGCQLISSELGANRARNAGIKASTGEIVALIDDDCVPDRSWMNSVISSHEIYPHVGVIGGCMKLVFRCTKPRWLEGAFMSALASIDKGTTVIDYSDTVDPYGSMIVSGNISFKRYIYDQTPGFDEEVGYIGKDSFMAYDEISFINECMKYGYPRRLYIGSTIVYHYIPEYRTTIDYFIKKHYGDGYHFMKVATRDKQNEGKTLEDLIVEHALHRWPLLLTVEELGNIRNRICHEESTRIYITNVIRCKIAFFNGCLDYLLNHNIKTYDNKLLLTAKNGI